MEGNYFKDLNIFNLNLFSSSIASSSLYGLSIQIKLVPDSGHCREWNAVICLLPSCPWHPFLFLLFFSDTGFLHYFSRELRELPTSHERVVPLVVLCKCLLWLCFRLGRGLTIHSATSALHLQFIFTPWLSFQVEHQTGTIFWHCLLGNRKKRDSSQWVFHVQYQPLVLLACGAGVGWDHPKLLFALYRRFLGGTIILVMHEVFDFCLILVGSQ